MLHDALQRGCPEKPPLSSVRAVLALPQQRAWTAGKPRSPAATLKPKQKHQRTGPRMDAGIPDAALWKHPQADSVPPLVCAAYRSRVATDIEELDVSAQQTVHMKTKA